MDSANMLSIKEFSQFTDLSESTLRYYDAIGLLPPALRGENNYRYYAPQQIIMSSFIKILVKLGISLSAIKELGKGRTPQTVLALLARQQSMLNEQLFELQEAYSIIHTYRSNIQAGIFAHELDMRVRTLEEARIILGPVNDFSDGGSLYRPLMAFYNLRHENGINVHYPIGGYYEDMRAFADAPSQPHRFFSLDPRGDGRRAAGRHLVAYNKGDYGRFGDLPRRMLDHAEAKNISFSGPVYVVYLLDEVSVIDCDHYVSQIAAGVTQGG